jgi:hypothetical protein
VEVQPVAGQLVKVRNDVTPIDDLNQILALHSKI